MEEHIVKAYDQELSRLNTQVSAMGSTCEWQLAKSLKALETGDIRLAEEVVKEDVNLNRLYRELEENTVATLAKRTPLAGDLRYLLTVMRAGATLERVGDYSASIARRVIELDKGREKLDEPAELIQAIGRICRQMIRDIIQAFLKSDVASAIAIWNRDDEVDRKFARLMTDLRARMQADTTVVNGCTAMIFMGRCLERIGDHITNIAEDIYYTETGETYIGNLDAKAQ